MLRFGLGEVEDRVVGRLNGGPHQLNRRVPVEQRRFGPARLQRISVVDEITADRLGRQLGSHLARSQAPASVADHVKAQILIDKHRVFVVFVDAAHVACTEYMVFHEGGIIPLCPPHAGHRAGLDIDAAATAGEDKGHADSHHRRRRCVHRLLRSGV